jgi:hypothetical protein
MSFCPNCNGMTENIYTCSECAVEMMDNGKVVDYLDNYSPYLDMSILEQVDGIQQSPTASCIHLYSCASCMKENRIEVPYV